MIIRCVPATGLAAVWMKEHGDVNSGWFGFSQFFLSFRVFVRVNFRGTIVYTFGCGQ